MRTSRIEAGIFPILAVVRKCPDNGYGRELIERALPCVLCGRTDHALAPGGMRCRIELPLAWITRRSPVGGIPNANIG